MKQLAWGDTLLGFEITPEGWRGGGVIQPGGMEWKHQSSSAGGKVSWFNEPGHLHAFANEEDVAPKYPPRGWNGLSEDEIWRGVVDSLCDYNLLDEDTCILDVAYNGNIRLYAEDYGESILVKDCPALIQALQNAQVLSERLSTK